MRMAAFRRRVVLVGVVVLLPRRLTVQPRRQSAFARVARWWSLVRATYVVLGVFACAVIWVRRG